MSIKEKFDSVRATVSSSMEKITNSFNGNDEKKKTKTQSNLIYDYIAPYNIVRCQFSKDPILTYDIAKDALNHVAQMIIDAFKNEQVSEKEANDIIDNITTNDIKRKYILDNKKDFSTVDDLTQCLLCLDFVNDKNDILRMFPTSDSDIAYILSKIVLFIKYKKIYDMIAYKSSAFTDDDGLLIFNELEESHTRLNINAINHNIPEESASKEPEQFTNPIRKIVNDSECDAYMQWLINGHLYINLNDDDQIATIINMIKLNWKSFKQVSDLENGNISFALTKYENPNRFVITAGINTVAKYNITIFDSLPVEIKQLESAQSQNVGPIPEAAELKSSITAADIVKNIVTNVGGNIDEIKKILTPEKLSEMTTAAEQCCCC